MPLVDGKEMSPDDAMAADRCPECGADLTKIHPRSHLGTHWTGVIANTRETEEARRRIAMFNKWLTAHPEPTA